MGNEETVSAKVTPAFKKRLENISDERGDGSLSETARHLMREGAQNYDDAGLIQSFFKLAALSLAVLALVVFAYGDAIGYARPASLGAWIMVPALISLALYDYWPKLSTRFTGSSSSTAEA